MNQNQNDLETNNNSEELVLSFDEINQRYNYNRSSSPQYIQLCDTLHQEYPGSTNCIVTSSGMGAIDMCIRGILTYHNTTKFGNFAKPEHDNYLYREMEHFDLIYANELYCDTPRLFKYLASTFALTLHQLDIAQEKEDIIADLTKIVGNHGRPHNTILFVESCSNPNGKIFDFSVIPKLKSLTKILYVVVDNTWLTNVVLNPFSITNRYNSGKTVKNINDIDFVVTSLTKYYSAGSAIGGAILSNNNANQTIGKISTTIFDMIRITGAHVSPHNCSIILEAIKTLDTRLNSSSNMTEKVMRYLTDSIVHKKHPVLVEINHPFVNYGEDDSLVRRYFKHDYDDRNDRNDRNDKNHRIGPSVFTMTLKTNKKKLLKVLKDQDKIDFKTSFGSKLSKIDPWPSSDGDFVNCRVSIGYDDSYDRVVQAIDYILSCL